MECDKDHHLKTSQLLLPQLPFAVGSSQPDSRLCLLRHRCLARPRHRDLFRGPMRGQSFRYRCYSSPSVSFIYMHQMQINLWVHILYIFSGKWKPHICIHYILC